MNSTTEKINRKGTRFLSRLTLGLILTILLIGCGGSRPESPKEEDVSAKGYAKLQALHRHEDSLLTKYKVLDKEKGIYRIPVSRALEIIAAEQTAKKGR